MKIFCLQPIGREQKILFKQRIVQCGARGVHLLKLVKQQRSVNVERRLELVNLHMTFTSW